MTYPMPNATNIVTFLSYGNDATGGLFWPLALIAMFAIMLGNLKLTNSWEDSFASASFFTGIVGIFLGILQFISGYITIAMMALAIIGAMLLIWRKTPTT